MPDPFDQLQMELARGGPAAALEQLAAAFRERGDFHALFDARLMQTRYRMGLPIILTTRLEELPEPQRGRVEEAYLEACRETGWLLWREGKWREAWMYLRPLGENGAVAEEMYKLEATEENRNMLIELALQEGVAPALGFGWILAEYGVCNAITTFDSEMPRHRRSQQKLAAAQLIHRLHADLVANIRLDIEKREAIPSPAPPAADSSAVAAQPLPSTPDSRLPTPDSLQSLLANRDWLMADNSYHIDTSHLAATVRIARIVDDPQALRLALDLTHYGRRLAKPFQLEGDEPFEEVYESHALFFAAQLGEQVDEAVAYFRERAVRNPAEEVGPAAAETYIVLLLRLGRLSEALDAHARLLPASVPLTGFAPTLLELAELARDYDRLVGVSRERNDLLGFAAGLVSSATATASKTAAR